LSYFLPCISLTLPGVVGAGAGLGTRSESCNWLWAARNGEWMLECLMRTNT